MTRTDSPDIPRAWQFKLPMASNATYTLSVWMKADKPAVPVQFRYQYGGDAIDFALTTEWQRYEHSFSPKGPRDFITFEIGRPGTVWLDAVQLEQGTSATEYEPRNE